MQSSQKTFQQFTPKSQKAQYNYDQQINKRKNKNKNKNRSIKTQITPKINKQNHSNHCQLNIPHHNINENNHVLLQTLSSSTAKSSYSNCNNSKMTTHNWKFLQNRRQNQLNTLFNIRKNKLKNITTLNRRIYEKIAIQQSYYPANDPIQNKKYHQNPQETANINTIKFLISKNGIQIKDNNRLKQIINNNLQTVQYHRNKIFGHISKFNTDTFDMAQKQFYLNWENGNQNRSKSMQNTTKILKSKIKQYNQNQTYQQFSNFQIPQKYQNVLNILKRRKFKTIQTSDRNNNVKNIQYNTLDMKGLRSMRNSKNLNINLNQDSCDKSKQSVIKRRYKSAHKLQLPDIITLI